MFNLLSLSFHDLFLCKDGPFVSISLCIENRLGVGSVRGQVCGLRCNSALTHTLTRFFWSAPYSLSICRRRYALFSHCREEPTIPMRCDLVTLPNVIRHFLWGQSIVVRTFAFHDPAQQQQYTKLVLPSSVLKCVKSRLVIRAIVDFPVVECVLLEDRHLDYSYIGSSLSL